MIGVGLKREEEPQQQGKVRGGRKHFEYLDGVLDGYAALKSLLEGLESVEVEHGAALREKGQQRIRDLSDRVCGQVR